MNNNNYEMVLIESSKRDQGTSTSFNFSLSRPIKNIYRIDLLYASLNNTFYTFRSTDVFKWNEIFFDRQLGVIDIVTGEISYDLPPQSKQFYFTDSSLSIDEFAHNVPRASCGALVNMTYGLLIVAFRSPSANSVITNVLSSDIEKPHTSYQK